MKATDPAAPQRVPGDMCAFVIPKTFLTQEEIILAPMACAAYCYPKSGRTSEIHLNSSQNSQYGLNKPSSKKLGKG